MGRKAIGEAHHFAMLDSTRLFEVLGPFWVLSPFEVLSLFGAMRVATFPPPYTNR
jgi:hypothetical protein